MLLKLNSSISVNFFAKSYTILVTLITIPGLVYQLLWAAVLGYNLPTPLSGFIGYLAYVVAQILIWFVISPEEKAKEGAIKRYKSYVVSKFITTFLADIQKDLVTIGFKKITPEYQWLFAFILPLYRELNILMLSKILRKMGDLDDMETRVYTTVLMNVRHAMYISIQLGTSASITTGYCILGVEFLINLWSVLNIVRMHRKITPLEGHEARTEKEGKKKAEILNLALIELIEVLVPLAYTSVIMISYHGPNFGVLGNIGSSIWQFRKIENIDYLLFVAIEMFVVDFMSAILAGIVFWNLCSINFIIEIYCAIKKYGFFISLTLSTALASVS